MLQEKLKELYELSLDRWIVSAFLITFPAHYFPIIAFFGTSLGLAGPEGQPNWYGIGLFFLFYVPGMLITGLRIYGDQNELKSAKSGKKVLSKILTGVNKGVRAKAARFRRYIRESNPEGNEQTFPQITKPIDQFRHHIPALCTCLSEALGIEYEDIGISLIVRFDRNDQWNLEGDINLPSGININNIIRREESAFYKVIEGGRNRVFYPNKSKAAERGNYCLDARDREYDGNGSIYCKNISINSGEHYIGIVISISTYRENMVDEEDEEGKRNLYLIAEQFEERLQLEAMLYYLRYISEEVEKV